MPDNLLIPIADLIRDYQNGRIFGAWLPKADNLPTDIRRIAQYQHEQAMDELPAPYFATAPKLDWKAGEWKGKRALLWKSWSQLDPEKALKGNQLTGDCVSWGERCKQDVRRCCEILLLGEREQYAKRQATCLLYSGRGHTGQGASPSSIANWATRCGILLEDIFTDADGKAWDFSDYEKYVNHGIKYGRSGMPKSIIDITSKNRVVSQSLVQTTEELCDLLYNCYACSVGFSLDTAPRGNPVSKLQGRTAHQTCIVGFDDTELGRAMCKKSLGYEDTVIFYDQSWGRWNEVTDIPEEWQPWGEGMYCHSARDSQRHLNEEEAYACSGGIIGFERTPIDNLLI